MNEGKKTVVVVHWRGGAELDARGQRIAALGYPVDSSAHEGGAFHRRLKSEPPCVLVIDLELEPERGRELATTLRGRASTGDLPLLFVGGRAEDQARTLAEVPDAIFTNWDEIELGLARAVKLPIPMRVAHAHRVVASGAAQQRITADTPGFEATATDSPAPDAPTAPVELPEVDRRSLDDRRARREERRRRRQQAEFEASFETHANASLDPGAESARETNLGPASATPREPENVGDDLGEGMRLAILAAPSGFAATLGRLPARVKLKTSARGKNDVLVLFCRDANTLAQRLPPAARSLVKGGRLWLYLPPTNEIEVDRAAMRELGLEDSGISTSDEAWTAHRYLRK